MVAFTNFGGVDLAPRTATNPMGLQSPGPAQSRTKKFKETFIWVVVKIMVPLCLLTIIRHLVFRGPRRGP